MESYPLTVGFGVVACSISVMLPIPGTSRVEHLEENVAAAELKIDRNQWQELDRMARAS